jgi:hypothetical protein
MTLEILATVIGLIATIASTVIAIFKFIVEPQERRHNEQTQKNMKILEDALTGEREANLERLRNDLKRTAVEHETKFVKLYAEQAVVVKDLYKLLVVAEQAFQAMANPIGLVGNEPSEEKNGAAIKAYNEFIAFYMTNRIYIDEDICGDIDVLINRLKEAGVAMQMYVEGRAFYGRRQDMDIWHHAAKIMMDEVPPILSKIESGFRKMLKPAWMEIGQPK